MEIVETMINHREKNNIVRNDLMQLMIDLRKSSDGPTKAEIVGNV